MLKSTNPNHHGHDKRGTTGTREYNNGFGVLSEKYHIKDIRIRPAVHENFSRMNSKSTV